MPSTLITESKRRDDQDGEIVLRDDDGNLTMEAETVADFIASADYSALADCDLLTPFIEEMDIDGEKVKVVDADAAFAVIDMDDLYEMFLNHLDALPADSLEEKARIAVWANFYGANLDEGDPDDFDEAAIDASLKDLYDEIDADEDLDEASKAASKQAAKKAAMKAGKLTQGATAKGKIKKGGLKKLAKKGSGPQRDTAVRMFLAMRHKGITKEDPKTGKVIINKAVSKKGGTAKGKKAVSKLKKQIGTEAEDGNDDPILMGHAFPLYGLDHKVQVKEMSEEDVKAFEEAFKKGSKAPPFMKKGEKKGKDGKPMPESKTEDGSPLLEGASLAGAVVSRGAQHDNPSRGLQD